MVMPLKKNSISSGSARPTAASMTILDVAERLAQTRGYNGFSYADIAAHLGVTKASLHYHFPSKADLGCALIERYQAGFSAALEVINSQSAKPMRKLHQYVGLYDSVLRNDRMCLCGMLAAEYETLPAPMQDRLKVFFDINERWLTALLQDGRRSRSFSFKESAKGRARLLLAAFEGAMLVARSYGDSSRFQSAATQLLKNLIGG